MFTLLLVIIYMSFISLGLPDALLGSAWPSMYGQLGVPVSYAGIVSMIIAAGTIVSSLMSDRLTRKLDAGKVTAISVGLTAAALFGFSVSHSFIFLCLWAIPYGLGAGSVDAALNNFVALHYASRHMSWLHCFWGVGASLGPYIMGLCLTGNLGWNSGYRIISILQVVLTAVLIFSLPLWKKVTTAADNSTQTSRGIKLPDLLRVAGVKEVLLVFFCYCALEQTAGLWASSYMVLSRGISAETAAKWASLIYLGITFGRFLSGFATMKLTDKSMVRLGECVCAAGVLALFLPLGDAFVFVGLILIGLGCAPIYPCIIHATPSNFGKNISQAIIGVQMACAYVGTCLMPPLFGFLAGRISIKLYPFYLAAFFVIMVVLSERMNREVKSEAILVKV